MKDEEKGGHTRTGEEGVYWVSLGKMYIVKGGDGSRNYQGTSGVCVSQGQE